MNEAIGRVRDMEDGSFGWAIADALLLADDGLALDPEVLVHVREMPRYPLGVIRRGNGFEVDRTRCLDFPFRRSARLDLIPASDAGEMEDDDA